MDPCLSSQAETPGTCSTMMSVIWFLHFWVDFIGNMDLLERHVSHKEVDKVPRLLRFISSRLMILVSILAQEDPEIQRTEDT